MEGSGKGLPGLFPPPWRKADRRDNIMWRISLHVFRKATTFSWSHPACFATGELSQARQACEKSLLVQMRLGWSGSGLVVQEKGPT